MPSCPRCQRPVAVVASKCLYCGEALPAGLLAAVETQADGREETGPPQPPTGGERVLVILDLEGADPEAVAAALGLSRYEAQQRVQRRGPQLHRVAPLAEGEEEASRLAGLGLTVLRIPEADARLAERPRVARGGRYTEGELELRGDEGPLRLARADLLIIVRGSISREFQASGEGSLSESLRGWAGFRVSSRHWRRGSLRTPEAGLRIHFHETSDPRPVELDPASFEFGGSSMVESSLWTVREWVEELSRGVPLDDGFRHIPPALGLPTGDAADPALLALSGGRGREKEGPRILDNLAQFRSYSAWRGAVERRRRAGGR